MTLDRRVSLLACILPFLILAAAPLFPSGGDPRGFGPRFAVAVVAIGVSFVLGLAGAGAWLFAKRLQIPGRLVAVATCIAAAPFLYVLGLIILGKA